MKVKNRLVRSATYKAAMAENFRTTDKILRLYRDLSEGGVGMIITGHCERSSLLLFEEKQITADGSQERRPDVENIF